MGNGFQVLFGDGAERADEAFYNSLLLLEVEENADLPGALQLTIKVGTRGDSASEDLTQIGHARFKPYARIAVLVTTDDDGDACIFDGYVLSHKIHLHRGTTASSLKVWCQDASALMNREERIQEWTGTDGEAANEIFWRYGFRTVEENTEDDSPSHASPARTLMQRASDAQFLRERARRNGKLFRVCCERRAGDNVGYFIKPSLAGEPVLTLTLNPPDQKPVDALDFEWDVARPTAVLARQKTFAEKDKDGVDGGATESGLDLLDARSLASFVGADHVTQARLTTTVDDAGELTQRAQSLLRESNWFVRCEGDAYLSRLNAVLRVATVVRINGAGKLHSGKYFVWSVRHAITATAHGMHFVLVRNAVGPPDDGTKGTTP